MPRPYRIFNLPFWFLWLCAGCTAQIDDGVDEVVGNSQAQLTGAYGSVQTPLLNAAVYANGCTGTLIAPDIVLTAGHCTAGASHWSDDEDIGIGNWRATKAGYDIRVGLHTGEGVNCEAVPTPANCPLFTTKAHFVNFAGFDDIALWLLDEPVPPTAAQPVAVMTSAKFASIGGDFGSTWLPVEGYGDGATTRQRWWAQITGDMPRGVNTIQTTLYPGANYGHGDSGGPLLWWDSVEHRYYVIGENLGNPGSPIGHYVATWREGNGADKPNISLWLQRSAPAAGANRRAFVPTARGDLWTADGCYIGEECMVGDFNGDGATDTIAFTGQSVYVGKSYRYRVPEDYYNESLQRGSGFEVTMWSPWFPTSGTAVAVANMNGDAQDEIFSFQDAAIFVSFASSHDGFTPNLVAYSGNACDPATRRCLMGNVDQTLGDGFEDILSIDVASGQTSVLRSDGTVFSSSGFNSSAADGLCVGDTDCVLADVNADGDDDLVVIEHDSTGSLRVFRNHNNAFLPPVDPWQQVCPSWLNAECKVGDVDADGRADLIRITNYGGPNVQVARNLGVPGPTFEWNWHRNICHTGRACMMGDVNGDGLDDIIDFTRDDWAGDGGVRIAASLAHFQP